MSAETDLGTLDVTLGTDIEWKTLVLHVDVTLGMDIEWKTLVLHVDVTLGTDIEWKTLVLHVGYGHRMENTRPSRGRDVDTDIE